VRRLATLLSRAGRGTEAVGILVRLLAVDPYDEQVHRRLVTGLVRAGRHGEARRAFDRWCLAMSQIDAPPPDRRVVHPGPLDVRTGTVLTPR
jgi:DNA-binding SARP family transcriptional activator